MISNVLEKGGNTTKNEKVQSIYNVGGEVWENDTAILL